MIKIKCMPKETLAELLLFISENENFASVSKHLHDSFTVSEVRTVLRELAGELAREAKIEGDVLANHPDSELSLKAREIVSSLPKKEGERLLAAFGLRFE